MRWPGPDTGVADLPGPDVGAGTFPGVDSGFAEFPPAPLFVMPIDASVSSEGTATVELITTPVYPMDVVGVGTASAAMSAAVTFSAAASGRGTAVAQFAEMIEAHVVGTGTATTVLLPAAVVDAGAISAGAAAATATPVAVVTASVSGSGTASVGAWPSAALSAAAAGTGTPGVTTTAHAVLDAAASSAGSASAELTAVTLKPAGILKSGTQSLTSSNAWHQVTGWVVDSTYPDTALSSNAIVVDGGGDAVLSAAVAWSNANGNRQCRIKVNGTVVVTSTATTGTPTIADFETALAPGDLVTLEAYTTTGFSAYRAIAVSGTFLRIAAVVPLFLRAADGFDGDGPLSSNWIPTGGGVLTRVNGRLDGTNTPSVPLSYVWWHEPMPSDTQQVEAVVRWDGRDPEHSATGLVVRADPFQDPVTNPGAQFGVQFSWTRGIMALYYEDYDQPNGFVPVTGVPQYVNTSKFPEGAVVTLRAEGNLYTARVNGVIMLQGTVANSVIPFSRRYVGATIQNDELVAGGGGPPGRLDDFKALTP